MEKLELSKKYTSCHKTGKKRTLCPSQARDTKSFFPCFVARNILSPLIEDVRTHPMNHKRQIVVLQDLMDENQTLTIEENSDSQMREYFLKTNHKHSSENTLSFHMKLDCYDHISEKLKQNNTFPKEYKPIH